MKTVLTQYRIVKEQIIGDGVLKIVYTVQQREVKRGWFRSKIEPWYQVPESYTMMYGPHWTFQLPKSRFDDLEQATFRYRVLSGDIQPKILDIYFPKL